jgi:hypothetical protein
MSLTQQIQEAITNPNMQLSDTLRLCKVLAVRLDNQTFKEWIRHELDGYGDATLPDYRVLRSLTCRGNFKGGHIFAPGITGAKLSFAHLDPAVGKVATTWYLNQGVNALENSINGARRANQAVLIYEWPLEIVNRLSPYLYQKMVCTQMWTEVPVECLTTVLDTIKNRILDFVIEIEVKAPEVANKPTSITSPPAEAQHVSEPSIKYIFDRCILNQPTQVGSTNQAVANNNQIETKSVFNNFISRAEFEIYMNNLKGANIGNMANQVNDSARQEANQNIQQSVEQVTLTQAITEILKLLAQLEQSNPKATESQQIAHIDNETTPSFKRRVSSAFQEAGGSSALDELIPGNKYLEVIKLTLICWLMGV